MIEDFSYIIGTYPFSFPHSFDMSIGTSLEEGKLFYTQHCESFLFAIPVIMWKTSTPETRAKDGQRRAFSASSQAHGRDAYQNDKDVSVIPFRRNKTVRDGQLEFSDFVVADKRQSRCLSVYSVEESLCLTRSPLIVDGQWRIAIVENYVPNYCLLYVS
ncbi:hypothetical protein Tco_0366929 [Tanacetum coccineum]